uniref:Uncharacterized protein n=1 Tax=Ascaris lumbricoides TaxID=6252 RepID=A0A0M3I2T8_ASCLU
MDRRETATQLSSIRSEFTSCYIITRNAGERLAGAAVTRVRRGGALLLCVPNIGNFCTGNIQWGLFGLRLACFWILSGISATVTSCLLN